MVDSLLFNLEQAKKTDILERLGLTLNQGVTENNQELTIDNRQSIRPYALLTLHRPSNVDDRIALGHIILGLHKLSNRIPILFPIHPRTKKQIKQFDMESAFEFYSSPALTKKDYYQDKRLKKKIHCFLLLRYLEFLNLMTHATVVLTDSGGIQEETTVLGIPCITLRDNTERPITVSQGTNVLVHNDPERIASETFKVLDGGFQRGSCPEIWDGKTAERIVRILMEKMKKRLENQI